ncbi:MAG: hypothetical protein ACOY5B_04135 [Spirochaetota bacterium]
MVSYDARNPEILNRDIFLFLVTGSSRAADMKFETCGLDGFWILDKVPAKGLEEDNKKLVACAITASRNFAHISNNRFCKSSNCIISARDDQMIDFLITKARKEQLAEIDREHGSIYSVLGRYYQPGKNEKLIKQWFKKISAAGVSPEEAQEKACSNGESQLYNLFGNGKIREGKFTVGQQVAVRIYDFHGKILHLCRHGASVIQPGSPAPSFFSYTEMLTLEEKQAETKGFEESRRKNAEKRAAKNQGQAGQSLAPENELDAAAERKRDKSKDIRAGTIVRVKSTSFNEKTSEPSMHAVCEAKTVLRRMPDGYYRGSIHCGGSAYYTFNVGAEIEEIKDKPPAEQSHNVRRCIERCLEKCGRPALGKEPSYGNTVCTQGCQPSCESTWGRN